MARAYVRDVLTYGDEGTLIALANAVGELYTDAAATVAATDAYAAASGGSPITQVTTDATGTWEVFFETAKTFYVKWTDNSDAAYPIGVPATLKSWTPFVRRHEAIDTLDDATTVLVAGTQTVTGTKHLATVTVKDRPWVDPTHPSFGMSTASSDNTAALQAAVDAAVANNVEVRITANADKDDPYPFTGTVNIWADGALAIRGLAGNGNRKVWLRNVTNNNPIFEADGETLGANSGFLFENLRVSGFGIHMTGIRNAAIDNCWFEGGGLGYAIKLENCWGWKYKYSHFQALGNGYKAIELLGRTPAFDVNTCYLHDFEDCVFFNGGVRYYQSVAPGGASGWFTFTNTYTENMTVATDSLFEYEIATGLTGGLNDCRFDGVQMYDNVSGTPPMVRVKGPGGGTHVGWSLINCTNSGVNLIQSDSAGPGYPNFRGMLMQGCHTGRIVGPDGVAEFGGQYGVLKVNNGGVSVVSRSEYDNISDSRGESSSVFASRHDTDRQFKHAVDHDGTHRWGPGGTGAGSTFDTVVGRGGVGFVYVPMLVKAGVPADGDFATAPPNGTLAVNSLTDAMYYRKAGTWTAIV